MFPILFFLIPIIEMYLLIEVAQEIDILPTVGLVLLTATVGIFLLKRQGFATLARGVSRLNRGELPAVEMVEGLLLAVSGAFLITPGFFLIPLPICNRGALEILQNTGNIMERTGNN